MTELASQLSVASDENTKLRDTESLLRSQLFYVQEVSLTTPCAAVGNKNEYHWTILIKHCIHALVPAICNTLQLLLIHSHLEVAIEMSYELLHDHESSAPISGGVYVYM